MGTDDLALPCSRPRERAAVGPRDGHAWHWRRAWSWERGSRGLPVDAQCARDTERGGCGKPREQVYSCARLYSARTCMYYVACATR